MPCRRTTAPRRNAARFAGRCVVACWGALALAAVTASCSVAAYPIRITDSAGHRIAIAEPPARVVSLVPSATDLLFAIDAGDAVVGVTYHDSAPRAARKTIVGGFAYPSIEAIEQLDPDLIIATSNHARRLKPLVERGRLVLICDDTSLAALHERIDAFGRLFDRREQAARLRRSIEEDLAHVQRKLARLPAAEQRRVVRLMGQDTPMVPGDDSFQHEMVRAAGGVPPALGREGAVVPITAAEWRRFDPQVVYHCETETPLVERLRADPEWSAVEAFREGRVHQFPCDLTCRISPHSGEFVASLASAIYPERFGSRSEPVLPERVLERREIDLGLSYVASAAVVDSAVLDFTNRTLLIDLAEPMRVISTLGGVRDGVRTIGNHYVPPALWGPLHELGPDGYASRVLGVLERDPRSAAMLITGADIRNHAVGRASYKEMDVVVLATAGVLGNAQRCSVDEGAYYEPGTINLLVLTSARLTDKAMSRAIIAATEAKTAALQDLDVRSTENPRRQATGTGTDNVVVVEGRGKHTIDGSGGHCKLGELIARATYRAVTDAIERQNGLFTGRSVFHRLHERGLSPLALVRLCLGDRAADPFRAAAELEHLLLDERYAVFVEEALALSDAHERGLLSDLGEFEERAREVARGIAPGASSKTPLQDTDAISPVLRLAACALLDGLVAARRVELRGADPKGVGGRP